MTAGRRSSVAELFQDGDCPATLYAALAKKWVVPVLVPAQGSRRTDNDPQVGATAESGRAIIGLLRNLASRRSTGFERLALLSVSGEGIVSVIHSLFLLPDTEFDDGLGELCALVGELPADGRPAFVRVDHFLSDPAIPSVEIIQVYGHRIRHGHFSRKPGVRADSVATAWRAIAQTHLLEGRPDPRKPPNSTSISLDLRLSRQLRNYSFVDPPPAREKAIPLGLVMDIAKSASTVKHLCISQLTILALFFCLRSCEYTKTSSHKRTVQFRFRDLQFHDDQGVIPFDAPDARFLAALAVTLFLDTQKNSVRGESSTMEATGLPHGDPVVAAAQRFLHLRHHQAPLDTPICTYYATSVTAASSVTGREITSTLRHCAAKMGYQRMGLYPHEIGSHSLRSGGAMTLKLAGISDSTIKIIGRWRTDAFLVYLQGQVATFTQGVSTAMSKIQWFQHTSLHAP